MSRPAGYRRTKKRGLGFVWALRLPEPHVAFLFERYTFTPKNPTLSNAIRAFLRAPSRFRFGVGREICGHTARHTVRLEAEDWPRLEALAKKHSTTPAVAFGRELEARARSLGYALVVKDRRAIW